MRETKNLALAVDSMVISERCMAAMFYPKKLKAETVK